MKSYSDYKELLSELMMKWEELNNHKNPQNLQEMERLSKHIKDTYGTLKNWGEDKNYFLLEFFEFTSEGLVDLKNTKCILLEAHDEKEARQIVKLKYEGVQISDVKHIKGLPIFDSTLAHMYDKLTIINHRTD